MEATRIFVIMSLTLCGSEFSRTYGDDTDDSNDDNGRNFTIVFTETTVSSVEDTHFVVVNPTDDVATVQIITALSTQEIYVPPEGTKRVFMYSAIKLLGSGIENKGIRIISSGDIKVICYNREIYHNDGFQALPDDVLGFEYYIITYCEELYYCLFGIVAKENDTVVNIKLSNNEVFQFTIAGESYTSGQNFTVTLEYLQSFQVKVRADLSGTQIISSKPIAVFSGNERSKMFSSYVDPSFDEVPPSNRLGTFFILVNVDFNLDHYAKFVSTEHDTHISMHTVDGCNEFSFLNSGDVLMKTFRNKIVYIVSNKPLQVAHFVQDAKGNTGMYYVPSVCEFQSTYATYAYGNITDDLSGYAYYNNFVILIIDYHYKDGLTDKSTNINTTWLPVVNTSYVVTVLPVSAGYHKFEHESDDVTFGGYLFGYVNSECYALPLGYNKETNDDDSCPLLPSVAQTTTQPLQDIDGDEFLHMSFRNYREEAVNKEPQQTPTLMNKLRSKVECAVFCTENRDHCISFTYEPSSKSCLLFGTSSSNFIDKNGANFMKYHPVL